MKTKMRYFLVFCLSAVLLGGCVSGSSKKPVSAEDTAAQFVNKEKEKLELENWYSVKRYNLKNKISGHKAFLNEKEKEKGDLLLQASGLKSEIREKEAWIEEQKQKVNEIEEQVAKIQIVSKVIREKVENIEDKFSIFLKDEKKLSKTPEFAGKKKSDSLDLSDLRKVSWQETYEADKNYYENIFNSGLGSKMPVAPSADSFAEESIKVEDLPEIGESSPKDESSAQIENKIKASLKEKSKSSAVPLIDPKGFNDYSLAILDGWRNEDRAVAIGSFLSDQGFKVDRVGVTNYVYKNLINKVIAYCKRPENNKVVALLRKGFSGYEIIVKKSFDGQKEDVVVVIGKNVLR